VELKQVNRAREYFNTPRPPNAFDRAGKAEKEARNRRKKMPQTLLNGNDRIISANANRDQVLSEKGAALNCIGVA
jgi:hypothetical protein